jgi:hypothetical protein
VVIVLLAQLFLRAHQITNLPVFIDEDNHMVRAARVHQLEDHPAELSHGKFLLYVLLATVDLNERGTALHLARTLVALTSLLTSVLIFVLLRRLTRSIPIALLGMSLYVLVPYAFFFERMALADPFAAALGTLTLYVSLRLVEKPTYAWAALVGACAAVTVAAKLTLAFSVGFPPLALLMLDANWRGNLRRFFPLMLTSVAVFVVLWLPVLIPARASIVDETAEDFVLVNTELLENQPNSDPLPTKVVQVGSKLGIWASWPMALVLVGLCSVALWKSPRVALFLLACLVLAWIPSVVIVRNSQSRYLMSGLPLLITLAGLGLSLLGRRAIPWAALGLAAWAILFALPYARTLITDPPAVHVPPLDNRNYFWDLYNGYGNREAMLYLEENGGGSVMVMTKMCAQMDLYQDESVTLLCVPHFNRVSLAEIEWENSAREALERGESLYAMTSEQSDVPPAASDIQWEQVAVFPKPHDIQRVTLWRLTLAN